MNPSSPPPLSLAHYLSQKRTVKKSPSSSQPPRSGGSPPAYPPGSTRPEVGRRWVLDSHDVLRRRWKKVAKGEHVLQIDRGKPVFSDCGVRNFYLWMEKAIEHRTVRGIVDSTGRLIPIPLRDEDKDRLLSRGYREILLDKCESNDVEWNDYPFFIKSLREEFPHATIGDLLSSIKFLRRSQLEELERPLRNAALQRIRKATIAGGDPEEIRKITRKRKRKASKVEDQEDVKECDLTELEQTEFFVQSCMARKYIACINGFLEYDTKGFERRPS